MELMKYPALLKWAKESLAEACKIDDGTGLPIDDINRVSMYINAVNKNP